MNTEQYFRHGDLLLKPIAEIPEDAAKVNTNVLAEGEATGHHHTLSGQCQVYAKGDTKFFSVSTKEGAKLSHQEHKQISIPEGNYAVLNEREFEPFTEELKKVMD